jgi:hypothetical protein
MLTLREVNGAGHRITDVEIHALVNGKWHLLEKSKCVGNRLAVRFPSVVTEKIKVKVLSALGEPLIYGFGIYMLKLDENDKKADAVSVNYAESPLCRIERGEKELDINFGGVLPFNFISVDDGAKRNYELYIFNGAQFERLACGSAENKIEIKLDKEIDYAYRIKLVSDTPFDKNAKITVKKS